MSLFLSSHLCYYRQEPLTLFHAVGKVLHAKRKLFILVGLHRLIEPITGSSDGKLESLPEVQVK